MARHKLSSNLPWSNYGQQKTKTRHDRTVGPRGGKTDKLKMKRKLTMYDLVRPALTFPHPSALHVPIVTPTVVTVHPFSLKE